MGLTFTGLDADGVTADIPNSALLSAASSIRPDNASPAGTAGDKSAHHRS